MPIASIATLEEAKRLLSPTGSALVVVPVFGAFDMAQQCISSILEHTPTSVDVLVIDDGSPDPAFSHALAQVGETDHRIFFVRKEQNQGFVRTMNGAFEVTGRRDVVLVNSDVIVGPEWFERMREAAYNDNRVATVTPLTNNGTIVSVPWRNRPSELLQEHTPQSAARAVARGSYRLRPRLPVCVGHAVYVRRSALDLVGGFDEAFSPGYGEEVDFSVRCSAVGLLHVCADDVFVYHAGRGSFSAVESGSELKRRHDELIKNRYPFYARWIETVASTESSALAVAIAAAKRALLGTTFLVDGTCLNGVMTGTQRITVELVGALSRHDEVARVCVLLPSSEARLARAMLPKNDRVEAVSVDDLTPEFGREIDITVRPYQVHSRMEDLRRLRLAGTRTIVWQLDFIAYQDPRFARDIDEWLAMRDLTRLTLATVDGVVFISGYTSDEGRVNQVVPPGLPSRIARPGIDHGDGLVDPVRPRSLETGAEASGYILCLGTDFRHKNRLFSLRVFSVMRSLGYRGVLVFAGPRAQAGTSRGDEAAFLLRNPRLKEHTHVLPHVTEDEREWLLRNADLVLYPSLAEGFGFIPFEAASASVPCLASRMGSLDEMLPTDVEAIEEWSPETVAAQAIRLIEDPIVRARQVELLRKRAEDVTWSDAADQLVELAKVVFQRPPNAVVAMTGERGDVIAVPNVPLEERSRQLLPSEFWPAIDAVARRRALRWVVIRPILVAYRILRRLYALRRPKNDTQVHVEGASVREA